MIKESVSLTSVNLIKHSPYAYLHYILNSVFAEALLSSYLGIFLPHLIKILFSTQFRTTFPVWGKELKLQLNLSIWNVAFFLLFSSLCIIWWTKNH